MPSPRSTMHFSSAPDLSRSPEAVRILLNVVTGIEGGRLQGIPWQTLPLTRSFVKERLLLQPSPIAIVISPLRLGLQALVFV